MKGFTLIEVIVYITLSTFLVSTLISSTIEFDTRIGHLQRISEREETANLIFNSFKQSVIQGTERSFAWKGISFVVRETNNDGLVQVHVSFELQGKTYEDNFFKTSL